MPNMIGFQSVLHGICTRLGSPNRKASIVVDQQSECKYTRFSSTYFLRFPATFRRRLINSTLQLKDPLLRDTLSLRSVVCWHTWLKNQKYNIRYLRPGNDGEYDFL